MIFPEDGPDQPNRPEDVIKVETILGNTGDHGLVQWLWEEFRLSVSRQTLGRELRAPGYAKLSARPCHHMQAADAPETFKKNFPARLEEIAAQEARGKTIEIWWQDEARIGQKNKITRRWARRENWLSNRVFTSYDDILDHCCHARNKLIDQPWKILSIGCRQWAHRF